MIKQIIPDIDYRNIVFLEILPKDDTESTII